MSIMNKRTFTKEENFLIFKKAVENIEKYQKDREEVSQLIMFDAPVDSLILSVKNHNQKTFSKNYKKLLHTCNACHLKTKYEFIQIKMPE